MYNKNTLEALKNWAEQRFDQNNEHAYREVLSSKFMDLTMKILRKQIITWNYP